MPWWTVAAAAVVAAAGWAAWWFQGEATESAREALKESRKATEAQKQRADLLEAGNLEAAARLEKLQEDHENQVEAYRAALEEAETQAAQLLTDASVLAETSEIKDEKERAEAVAEWIRDRLRRVKTMS